MPALELAHRTNTLHNLLVLFQVPPVSKHHQDMAAVLQIKAVTGRTPDARAEAESCRHSNR